MAAGRVSQFPEKPRTDHQPDPNKSFYHKNSQSVGAGHEEFDGRMQHPFRQSVPNDESGEGQN